MRALVATLSASKRALTLAAVAYVVALGWFQGHLSSATPPRDAVAGIVEEIRAYKKARGSLPPDLKFTSPEARLWITRYDIRYDPIAKTISSHTSDYYVYTPLYRMTFGLAGARGMVSDPGFDLNAL